MSKLVLKTFRVCLVWALLGAGAVAVYHYVKPYVKNSVPQLEEHEQKLKTSFKELAEKPELKKLIDKVLPDTKAETMPPKVDIAKSETIEKTPEVVKKEEPVKQHSAAKSETEDPNDIFNRQVAIVNDLMQ